jgi:rSAM/selenodomain-associated transferase 2
VNIASCRHAADLEREGVPEISVIIPTLNEADSLAETVRRAKGNPEVSEIIVVDAGSQDRTKVIAEELGCRAVNGPRSRGGQLRLGAAQAQGEVVLLLHADTWLPPHAGRAALECLRGDGVVAGGFWKAFRNPHPLMRGSRWRCALRLWLGGRIMGDQAMFVRREILEQVGGVPDVPLMEEFELCRRLRRVGRLALAKATVTTSARRFHQHGVLRTYWRMWSITVRYWLGASPQELRKRYEKS